MYITIQKVNSSVRVWSGDPGKMEKYKSSASAIVQPDGQAKVVKDLLSGEGCLTGYTIPLAKFLELALISVAPSDVP